jgi:hypothetical protein
MVGVTDIVTSCDGVTPLVWPGWRPGTVAVSIEQYVIHSWNRLNGKCGKVMYSMETMWEGPNYTEPLTATVKVLARLLVPQFRPQIRYADPVPVRGLCRILCDSKRPAHWWRNSGYLPDPGSAP